MKVRDLAVVRNGTFWFIARGDKKNTHNFHPSVTKKADTNKKGQKRMAVMTVGVAGIETISGALKRPKKQDGHNHGNYLVATHRKAATTNPNCQRVYAFGAER